MELISISDDWFGEKTSIQSIKRENDLGNFPIFPIKTSSSACIVSPELQIPNFFIYNHLEQRAANCQIP